MAGSTCRKSPGDRCVLATAEAALQVDEGDLHHEQLGGNPVLSSS